MSDFERFLSWYEKKYPDVKLGWSAGRWVESILKYNGDAGVPWGRKAARERALQLVREFKDDTGR